MSFKVHVSGAAEDAIKAALPQLVADLVASGIQDYLLKPFSAEGSGVSGAPLTDTTALSSTSPVLVTRTGSRCMSAAR